MGGRPQLMVVEWSPSPEVVVDVFGGRGQVRSMTTHSPNPPPSTPNSYLCMSIHVCMCAIASYSTDHKQLNIYSRVLAKSSRVRVEYSRARVHCPRAEVLHSLVRTRELRVARVRQHCERKYYTRTYGPRMRAHSYGTRARAHSYCTRECCIDLSRALAPPSRVERARVLSCL